MAFKIGYLNAANEMAYLEKDLHKFSDKGYEWKRKNNCKNVLKMLGKTKKNPIDPVILSMLEIVDTDEEKQEEEEYRDLQESIENSLAEEEAQIKDRNTNEEKEEEEEEGEPDDYLTYNTSYVLDDYLEKILDLVNAVTEADDVIKRERGILEYTEKEQQDILHLVEFNEIGDDDSISLMQKLREVRLKRRQAKDRIEVLTTLLRYIDPTEAEQVIKVIKNLCERKYTERSRSGIFTKKKELQENNGTEEIV